MIELIVMCAPDVAPETMMQIIQTESGGNPYAVNVNKLQGKQPKPRTEKEAAEAIHYYLSKGYSVDIGYAQINSDNLHLFGLTKDEAHKMLNPCLNISASNHILLSDYKRALKVSPDPQTALKKALSAYNTGNFQYGFKNGYVAKYYKSNSNAQSIYSTSTTVEWDSPDGYYLEEKPMKPDDVSKTELDLSMSARDVKLLALSEAQGIEVEFEPQEAESLGAFYEDALSFEDAKASSTDPSEVNYE